MPRGRESSVSLKRAQLVDLLLQLALIPLLSAEEKYKPCDEKQEKRDHVQQEAWGAKRLDQRRDDNHRQTQEQIRQTRSAPDMTAEVAAPL
jgi:hypothetical protein